MRTTISSRCARRKPRSPDQLAAWARSVVAQPARHHATEREAEIVAKLLGQVTR